MVNGRVSRRRSGALASFVVVTSLIVAAVASPAEARRRHHHSGGGGGGYSPPYAAMVVDANTGRTLYAENEDSLRHPASITKVMTLYLLFEQIEKGRFRLDSPLKVSAWASRQAPSKLGLRPGDEIEVEDAIKALVTKSANDVAVTVAENIAGSESEFADQMTRKARQLGMTRTVYKNASGLPNPAQVTTARDLITLGRAIQDRFPRYYTYFSTRSFAYNGAVNRNHNRLLGKVEGMDGIKTGYTAASGFNLLTSVRTGGKHVIAVVLGGRSAAARDRQMVSLIDTYTDRAYAGGRTAPAVAESADVADAEPATPAREPAKEAVREPVKEQAKITRVTAYDEDSTTTASLPPKLAKVVDAPVARPVVASAVGTTTTTPSSGMKWVVGAQPKGENARTARLETRTDGTPSAKAGKADDKAEAKTAVRSDRPKSAVNGWIIQLGATDDEAKAKDILQRARAQGRAVLAKAEPFTEKVSKGRSTLYRARFSGFDEDNAQTACKSLQRSGFSCFAARGG